MSYRRRDAAPGYSSADAYRSLPSTSPSLAHARAATAQPQLSSSDEDAHLTSPVSSPQPTPIAASFVRQRTGSASRSRPRRESAGALQENDIIASYAVGGENHRPAGNRETESPLSPPRPQYLAGDRRSWSASSTGTTDPEPASDSDNSAAPAANLAGVGSGRPPSVDYSNSRAAARTRAATGPVPPRVSRNHRRRSSMANEYAYTASAGEDDIASPPASSNGHTMSPISATAGGNPFTTPTDTPRNSFYGAPTAVQPGVGGKVPPSSFPFQSHPGNPDPGLSIPGAARRTSLESLRARGASPGAPAAAGAGAVNATLNNPLTPPGSATGTVYPVPQGGQAYGLLSDVEELGRPYAPFMGDGSGTERSQTPPSPMASQSQLYRGSVAGAMGYGGEESV